jgi:hypothetical protein
MPGTGGFGNDEAGQGFQLCCLKFRKVGEIVEQCL